MKHLFFLLLLLSSSEINSQNIIKSASFEDVFIPSDTLYINFTDELFLEHPRSLCFTGNILIWGQENSFFSFDKTGNLIDSQIKKGRGPGEFERAVYYTCKPDNSFSVLAAQSYKISSFLVNNETGEYNLKDEFRTKNYKTKKFIHLKDSYVTLNELTNSALEVPALSIYGENGTLKKEIGTVPENAQLQFLLQGSGGLTKDSSNNIYYSFLGSHKVWKWDTIQDSIYLFDDKPEYFVNPDNAIVKSLSTDAARSIRYTFEITRTTGLFYVEPNLIIQQLEPDNYLVPGTIQNVLIEVFTTKGEKKYTPVKIPNTIAFTYKDMIYIPTDFYNDLIMNKGKTVAFIGYKLINL